MQPLFKEVSSSTNRGNVISIKSTAQSKQTDEMLEDSKVKVIVLDKEKTDSLYNNNINNNTNNNININNNNNNNSSGSNMGYEIKEKKGEYTGGRREGEAGGGGGDDEDVGLVSQQKKPTLPEMDAIRRRNAIFSVCFYWVTSLSLVFLNKMVMVGEVTKLDAPLFMSWTQFIVTIFCCWGLGRLGQHFKTFSFFPPFEYKLDVAQKVLPLTFVFLGMIIFNNLCLKYVEVSFYQVARSLTIVFNVILTYCLLGQKTDSRTITCCGIILIGYLIGCDGEVRFSFVGAVFGLLSSVFVALNSIYVKKILPAVDDNSDKLMLYNNINAAIILFPFIYAFTADFEELAMHIEVLGTGVFWTITIVAGIAGYLINFASYLQIKYTSPLSHNVSGTAKAAAQTVIALLVFKNPVTVQGIFGLIVVILGSFAYSRAK